MSEIPTHTHTLVSSGVKPLACAKTNSVATPAGLRMLRKLPQAFVLNPAMLTCPNGEYFACIFWARPERRRGFGRVLVVFEAGHSGGSVVRSFSGQGNGDAADASSEAAMRHMFYARRRSHMLSDGVVWQSLSLVCPTAAAPG